MAKSSIERHKVIVRASLVGIAGNVVLSAVKAIIGFAAGSIAIVSDAVNNLSDAAASCATIIGAKYASRQADKLHPMGHGRAEYLSSLVVAVLIMYAGITIGSESIKGILHPAPADYSIVALAIIAISIFAKVFLAWYMNLRGSQTNSQALIGSARDALYDVLISTAVLAAAIVYMLTGFILEPYVGLVIAVIIVKGAYDMMRETVSDVLGHRIDSELSRGIKHTIEADSAVRGVYDLMVENYGPDLDVAQVNVEVDDTMTAAEIDDMTRRLRAAVRREHHVTLTTVGIYDYDTQDPQAIAIREKVTELAMEHDGVVQVHGFHVDTDAKIIHFDMVIDFDVKDRVAIFDHIMEDLMSLYKDYVFLVVLDRDLSD